MFTVGKEYMFRIIGERGDQPFQGTVEAYEYPLLKLAAPPEIAMTLGVGSDIGQASGDHIEFSTIPEHGKIFNVSSQCFVSAQEVMTSRGDC